MMVSVARSIERGTDGDVRTRTAVSNAVRTALVVTVLLIGFAAIATQLIRLAGRETDAPRIAAAAPIAESYSRPDILDRDGRVLATDILLPSIIADPSRILDVDEAIDALGSVLPPENMRTLRARLANTRSQFTWVARKVSTALAERVNHLGLPGIGFRWETKRTYPAGEVAGRVVGAVDIKNRGIAGLERHLDVARGLRLSRDVDGDTRPPLRTSLLISAQHAVEAELEQARRTYEAQAASGLVMDIETGEVIAAASLPLVDPAFPEQWVADGPIDHLMRGRYELGSVFKAVTVAMAMEFANVGPDHLVDVRTPIRLGRFEIADKVPHRQPLTLAEVFTTSSNVGSGRLALRFGADRQRAFLSRLGLLGALSMEIGRLPKPVVPERWGEIEAVTISYGHGIAMTPMQFAAGATALINGGFSVTPTLLRRPAMSEALRKRVVSQRTSDAMRQLFRANVVEGTARLADVAGYEIGGKTGTADLARDGRYDGKSVITSFVAAFPMSKPRYLVLTTLYDPQPGKASRGQRVAGLNVVPATGKLIARVAPLLGLLPKR